MRAEKRMLFWSTAVVGAALVMGGLFVVRQPETRAVFAQQQEPPEVLPRPKLPSDAEQPAADGANAHMNAERMRMMNDDRHKRLAADADRLVQLSTELKTEVNNTGRDELSIEVIRKAAEIEKLAHDVQSRMKN